ncbi:AEC family transporter [Sphingobacterium bambusae]|uniref:AEC family transporter n=1 Tax=Sphingobacterium bambusae TaxID=662858 RepID=A0ABW6BJL9_9SPHI|nr:AEC family transporter [Sphingobacterium bambusae]WPL49326.1 AEC family transporter [Sphingobacterium bambusae]
MSNFLVILFCLFAGYLLKERKIVRADGFKSINTWIVYIGLPATSFRYLPGLHWDDRFLLLLLAPVFILLGAIVFIKLLQRRIGFSRRTAHTLMLVSGFSNTSFVGFPLVASYFGDKQISWAIISDQMTFFLLSAVGTVIALKGTAGNGKNISLADLCRRVLSFPPLWGCMAALLLPRFIDLDPLQPFFAQLAGTVSPLALFSIGMQLSFSFYRSEIFAVGLSLTYKLLLGPAFLLLLCYGFGMKGQIAQVAIFEMAMPNLVATSLLLQQFNLNAKLGHTVIGLSILAGLGSTWLFYQVLVFLL